MKASVALILPLLFLVGCLSANKAQTEPDSTFGNRSEDGDEGRVTTVIGPAKGNQVYRYGEAFVDDVTVRPATGDALELPVEVLIKGAFPDSCTELHEANQVRSGNLIEVTLRTRRPQGAMCASVIRPFRFYLTLDGLFEAGPYTLKLNGGVHPFEVRR